MKYLLKELRVYNKDDIVQSLSHVWFFANPWAAGCQASLSLTTSQSLLKPMSIVSMMPSNHRILCRPHSFCPQSFPAPGSFVMSWLFASGGQSFSFSFSISPSNEYSGLISFRIDWFDLFAVQGTLKSLLQHHHSKASILQCSIFFMVQLSHPYMTTGKTIALTIWTFVGKKMSLLFNILSRFVIKISGRNINNLRFADDTTLMAEREEKLKSLLMKLKKENEKLA